MLREKLLVPPRTSFERVLFWIERTCTCHLHYAYTLLLIPSPLSHHSCLVKFARIKIGLAAWICLNPVLEGIAPTMATPIFCCFACMAQVAEGCEFRVTWIAFIKIRQKIFKSKLLFYYHKKGQLFLHLPEWRNAQIFIIAYQILNLENGTLIVRHPCSRNFFGGVWIYKPVRYFYFPPGKSWIT